MRTLKLVLIALLGLSVLGCAEHKKAKKDSQKPSAKSPCQDGKCPAPKHQSSSSDDSTFHGSKEM